MNPIKDIVIVGGGTAGLITALIFKTSFPHYNIKLIKSSDVGIIGVGEGSTEHWNDFQEYVGIDPWELIVKTDATFKLGILFKDWKKIGSSYVHNINFNPNPSAIGHIEMFDLLSIQTKDNPYILSMDFDKFVKENSIHFNQELNPTNQYHFDTHKLNIFLQKKCKEIKIQIEDHYIKNINLDNKGNISSLLSNKEKTIKGDFFIDCTGFKRILSSKLNTKFISYQKYLPMNRAITLSTNLNLDKGIEPYTKCTALNSGWAWKIPTQKKYGNGYVFDNRYLNTDSALNEFNQHLKINAEKAVKDIKFEAGRVDQNWVKNCVNIGLSSGFIEPLEAQSIGSSIIQAFALVNSFNTWLINPKVSNKYNKHMIDVFNNNVDYIQLHYFSKRKDSKFWKDKPFEITSFNKESFIPFSKGNFSNELFFDKPYLMFRSLNFYQTYYGLDLLDKDSLKKTIQQLPQDKLKSLKEEYKKILPIIGPPRVNHVDILESIKLNYSS
jgi:hypothetical protein|tara:strand:+ start:115 stop:1602 length:1488 start_codon:yes stop_codon:yes gene_type:complete